jgi:hypothetical protein
MLTCFWGHKFKKTLELLENDFSRVVDMHSSKFLKYVGRLKNQPKQDIVI